MRNEPRSYPIVEQARPKKAGLFHSILHLRLNYDLVSAFCFSYPAPAGFIPIILTGLPAS